VFPEAYFLGWRAGAYSQPSFAARSRPASVNAQKEPVAECPHSLTHPASTRAGSSCFNSSSRRLTRLPGTVSPRGRVRRGDTERLVWWTRSFGLGSGPSRDRLSPGSAERRWSKGHFSSGGGREHYKNPNAAGQVVWVDARDWGRIACPRRADLPREGVSGEIRGVPSIFGTPQSFPQERGTR